MTGQVAWGTRALGFLDLMPQAALLTAVAIEPMGGYGIPLVAAYAYAALILSFIGGIWWGIAMRREAGQGELAALAILPALAPLALPLLIMTGSWPTALIVLGGLIAMTPLVDRRLVANGEVPAGWLALRLPLSLGLGGMTIAAGVLAIR